MISIRPAEPMDAFYLGYSMRDEDRAEVEASGRYTPAEAVLRSIRGSTEAWTAEEDGEVLVVWGVATTNVLGGQGVIWALTSKWVDKHPKEFYRRSREVVADLRTRYAVLVNAVDARYERALRWVSRLGFEVHEAKQLGVGGEPFHPIVLRGVDHV